MTEEDAVMQEEIFGPVLPVLPVASMEEAYAFVKRRPRPLALYLFTADRKTEDRFLRDVSFGGGCVMIRSFIWLRPGWDSAAWETAGWVLIMDGRVLRLSVMRKVW